MQIDLMLILGLGVLTVGASSRSNTILIPHSPGAS
jgi:hypothetical protein